MFEAIRNILSATLSTQDSSRDRNPASDPDGCASSTDTRPSDEWLATWGYHNDAQPGEEWEWLDVPSSRPSPSMLSIGSARITTPVLPPLDEPLPLLSAITPSGLEGETKGESKDDVIYDPVLGGTEAGAREQEGNEEEGGARRVGGRDVCVEFKHFGACEYGDRCHLLHIA